MTQEGIQKRPWDILHICRGTMPSIVITLMGGCLIGTWLEQDIEMDHWTIELSSGDGGYI